MILKYEKEINQRINYVKSELNDLTIILNKIKKEKCECGVHDSMDNSGYDECCGHCGLRW